MITYNELYDALRKERYSEQLQPIPKNFVKEVGAYLNDKKEIALRKNDDFLLNVYCNLLNKFERSERFLIIHSTPKLLQPNRRLFF